MRTDHSKQQHLFTAAVILLMVIAFGFAPAFKVFAEEGDEPLQERHVWFTYGYTECTGTVYPCSQEEITAYSADPGSEYPSHYAASMMVCDTDHIIHVEGSGMANDDDVEFTSLDPDVLEVDSDGRLTPKQEGRASIAATVPADDTYAERTVYFDVTVGRHDGWIDTAPVYYEGRSPFFGIDLKTTDGTQQLVIPLRPGASATCRSLSRGVVIVEPDGAVTPLKAGQADLYIDVDDGGGRYKAGEFHMIITVTGEDIRSPQEISGDMGPFEVDWHDGLVLDLHAETELRYYVLQPEISPATVDSNGAVTFGRKGTATIKVIAEGSKDYKEAETTITITGRDYAEEAAKEKEEALKKEIARAKSLKRPTLTAKALSGHKNKLTWSKVKYADGYILYIKYPGTKKYKKALTKDATVKSVVHRGLSKKRAYYYKVRAFKKVKGKYYYGPFSKVKKVRVK